MQRHRNSTTRTLAQGLGYFSLALGAVELLAPRMLGRALGMEDQKGLLQAYGAREIVTGIGLLTANNPTPWMWGRVGGDTLDLATLAPGLSERNPHRGAVGVAIAAVAGVALLDYFCAQALSEEGREEEEARDYGYGNRSGFPNGRPVPELATSSASDLADTEAHPS